MLPIGSMLMNADYLIALTCLGAGYKQHQVSLRVQVQYCSVDHTSIHRGQLWSKCSRDHLTRPCRAAVCIACGGKLSRTAGCNAILRGSQKLKEELFQQSDATSQTYGAAYGCNLE